MNGRGKPNVTSLWVRLSNEQRTGMTTSYEEQLGAS